VKKSTHRPDSRHEPPDTDSSTGSSCPFSGSL
jgi:hypothetical protein